MMGGRNPTAIACQVWAQEHLQHRWDSLLLQSYALQNVCICLVKMLQVANNPEINILYKFVEYGWELEADMCSYWQSQVTNSLEEVMQYCTPVINDMMISFHYKTVLKCTNHFFQVQCCIQYFNWMVVCTVLFQFLFSDMVSPLHS